MARTEEGERILRPSSVPPESSIRRNRAMSGAEVTRAPAGASRQRKVPAGSGSGPSV